MAFAAACLLAASSQHGMAADAVVVDGGSLVYAGKSVELWGIIAPSRAETCFTTAGEKWACGEKAFAELSSAVADETFACEDKEAGFVVCRAGGLDVALLLVKEGLARARQDYADVEARAREAKIGLWE